MVRWLPSQHLIVYVLRSTSQIWSAAQILPTTDHMSATSYFLFKYVSIEGVSHFCTLTFCLTLFQYHKNEIQRPKKWPVCGLVKFLPALPWLFCLALPGSFLNMFCKPFFRARQISADKHSVTVDFMRAIKMGYLKVEFPSQTSVRKVTDYLWGTGFLEARSNTSTSLIPSDTC